MFMNPQRANRKAHVLALALLLSGLSGCSTAVVDAAAAGGLGFVQSTVSTMLSSLIFGESTDATDMTMDSMMTEGGGHTEHGG